MKPIDITKKKPPYDREVLLWIRMQQRTGWYVGKRDHTKSDGDYYKIAWFANDKCEFVKDAYWNLANVVTHWVELPDYIKGEGDLRR